MRGQLTGLWRAADGQPLSWRNPQRFSWSVREPGVPTGVTAGPWGCQPPLPRTLHAGACVSLTTTSACFKEGGHRGETSLLLSRTTQRPPTPRCVLLGASEVQTAVLMMPSRYVNGLASPPD